MSFWFVGTGEFAALCLLCLAKNFEFSRVITKPPSIGNRMKAIPSPVEEEAFFLELPLCRTARLSSDETIKQALRNEVPSGIFVIDFGEKITEPFLNFPRLGCLNIHPSLLPKYRGAAPIQRALENGDEEIGVTLFRLVEQMDAGGIIAQASEKFPLTANCVDVMRRMAEIGCELANGIKKNPTPILSAQDDSQATFAPKILKDEWHQTFDIDARVLHNRVRAFCPSAWVEWGGKRLKLIETFPAEENGERGKMFRTDDKGNPIIGCASGSICLKKVQPEGKRVMQASDWVRGLK